MHALRSYALQQQDAEEIFGFGHRFIRKIMFSWRPPMQTGSQTGGARPKSPIRQELAGPPANKNTDYWPMHLHYGWPLGSPSVHWVHINDDQALLLARLQALQATDSLIVRLRQEIHTASDRNNAKL